MKFMLLMHVPKESADCEPVAWSPDDAKAHGAYMHRMDQQLRQSGEHVGGEGLASPAKAKLVRAGKDGETVVTDGPFAETKEFLAGFWIVEVASPERAYAIAAEASRAPGPGGQPMSIPFEVRQVVTGGPPA
jgi:hypothetical protein